VIGSGGLRQVAPSTALGQHKAWSQAGQRIGPVEIKRTHVPAPRPYRRSNSSRTLSDDSDEDDEIEEQVMRANMKKKKKRGSP